MDAIEYLWPMGAYVLGSIPFGLLIARSKGIDLRSCGSGNIGATNVARVIGKPYGLVTLLADLAKGLVPVLAYKHFALGQPDSLILALTGLLAVLGHCFSVFLGFKGGKGVATATGVFLGLCPAALGLSAICFVAAVKLTGFVSVGSLASSAVFPFLLHFICPDPIIEPMAWSVTIVIWYRHQDNIRRLVLGEEKSWKKSQG